MKKLLWLGVVVVALLSMTSSPAMAEGGNRQNRWQGTAFVLVGQVTAVDTAAGTITVQVHAGNRLVKDYLGKALMVATTKDTLFLLYGDPKCQVITLEDVRIGAYVSINGIVVTGEGGNALFVANRVTVDAPLQVLLK